MTPPRRRGGDRWVPFTEYARPIRVDGGIRAQSTKGDIGSSWWSKRFIAVLESFQVGGRLTRGKAYARAGQVLSLEIAPGVVTAQVQGSRPQPYRVSIGLSTYDSRTWTKVERAMAAQALYLARLLAGEMPEQIEEVFAQAQAPLFPTRFADLEMACDCPDQTVPCKHLAATCYLLAEAFDADPFQILHWRGRDRETLLAHLRTLRESRGGRRSRTAGVGARPDAGDRTGGAVPGIGAGAALADMATPALSESLDRYWVAPVPLPARPATLVSDVDLVLRMLPTPEPAIGGPALVEALRDLYATFRPPPPL